jgi:RNA recognition motif-containing protein
MAIDDGCKLFVAGLPDSITEAILRQLFEATGSSVIDVSLPRDRATGRPRGFGFVTLSSVDEARVARESLDGSMQSGRSISVRPFQAAAPKRADANADGPPPDRGPPRGNDDRTLYLGNLPYDATGPEVEALLEGAGVSPVVRVNLPQDAQGRPRGFGFVTLGSVEAAQAAVEALKDKEVRGRRVSASIALGRGERAARPPPHTGGPPRTSDAPGGFAPRPDRRPPRESTGPRPDGDPFYERGTFDEPRRQEGKKRKEKKKKKGVRGAERSRSRRDNEGFRAPRARDWMDEDKD